jgi:resuscitation-promoting factor RpfB
MKNFSFSRGHINGQYSTAIKQREFFVGGALAVLLFTTTTFSAVANNNYDVTLYVDGISRTVGAKDITVAEVLKRQNVLISPADVVEPSLDTTINADSFKVNVFRARPILIIDGANKTTVTSALNSPKLIVESAGIKVFPEDEMTLERIEDPSLDGQIGQKLTIKRATEFTVNLYGTPTVFHSPKTTISEALADKKIVVAEGDRVEPALDQPLVLGATVKIIKIGQETVTADEKIDFAEETVNDENQLKGYVKVEREGLTGTRRVTFTLTTNNGAEVSRVRTSEVVVTAPVSTKVIRGSKVPEPVAPPTLAPFAGNVSAQKQAIMAAVGISPSDYSYVDYIMIKESGWNAGAVNPSSGAYGICQSLPGSKMASAGSDWQSNAVTQMRWCDGYARGRYGGWANAYNAWRSKNWW